MSNSESDNIVLDRILRRTPVPDSEIGKALSFYRTILELERDKEPQITFYYSYPLNFLDTDSSVMLIDLPCNAQFLKDYCDNRNRSFQFQKDLFIGLSIQVPTKKSPIVIFCITIDKSDLKDYDPNSQLLPCRISQLNIDACNAEIFELDTTKINQIESELSKIKNLSDLQYIVTKYFGHDAKLIPEIKVSLCSKNIALAQIYTEIKNLSENLVERNDLLSAFLTHNQFYNELESVSIDELLPVTNLDESQEEVIAHALSNRFSVVTGAPGTGKTQVILNIIANALIRNKSVLVASKNNKAVENVKERFDLIDPSLYLIRFGNKEYVRTKTLMSLDRIIQVINDVKNSQNNLTSLLNQYNDVVSRIRSARINLNSLNLLKLTLSETHKKIVELRNQISKEDVRHRKALDAIRSNTDELRSADSLSVSNCESILSALKKTRNRLQRKYSGFANFWNNLFSKNKDAERFLNQVEELPIELKTCIRTLCIGETIDHFKKGEDIVYQVNKIIRLTEQVKGYLLSIEKEEFNYNYNKAIINRNLASLQEKVVKDAAELEKLQAHKQDYESDIRLGKSNLGSLGIRIIEAKIRDIERHPGASQNIARYKSYLPNNLPCKSQELVIFNQSAKAFINTCKLIATTSLSVRNAFPLTERLFDILIIDEASQCDVASAIPLILRAKQVVVIGDPMQLRHITSVKEAEEKKIIDHLNLSDHSYINYVRQSLWDFSNDFVAMAKTNSSSVTLRNHYRCHHDIIGYSNDMFYGRFLSKPLDIRTDETNMHLTTKGIVMVDIRGVQEADRVNINKLEAEKAIQIAEDLNSTNGKISIGIVTPFRDQADYIMSRLPYDLREKVEVSTAHGFQGDEKDVMIYSLVVTDNSPQSKLNWIDFYAPNLVNVAVTRARQTLYVIGNASYIQHKSSPNRALGYLVKYALSK